MRSTFLSVACGGAIIVVACAHTPASPAPTPARVAIDRLIDSARTAGLPVGPLESTVREGVSKGASDELILRALQNQVTFKRLTETDSVLQAFAARMKANGFKP